MSAASSHAVFLSYAREDSAAAQRIADALRAFGVEVWFDQSELRGGDAWDQKIRTQIKTCALFVPMVSTRTEERTEGYFRREWKLAVERTQDMAAGRAFIVPIVIDETSESDAAVPEEFMRYQWTRLEHGIPTPEFVAQVKRLLDGPRKTAAGPRLPSPAAAPTVAAPIAPEPRNARSASPWVFGVIAAAAIAAAIYFALRPPRVVPATVTAAPVAAQTGARASAPAVLPVPEKSIAVLPFSNMSEEKDSSFFADGIHEDILTNLALVRDLHVVSRTSVMEYRGTTKKIRQIAQELGVAYVLEGSVRRAGNRVRVTGQLIRAANDDHVWAKAYDRDLTDIFSIQAELSQEIAAALSAALSPQERQLLERRPTENLAAYDAYLKARQIRQANQGGTQPCEPLLEEAVRLDPKFAVAWAELASAMTQTYFNDVDRSESRLARARTAIETAVRLAPNDPDVIERQGDYYYYGHRDFERATEQYLRLAVLRPNDAAVSGSLGFIHRRQGRWAEALQELTRASELAPRDLRYSHTLIQLNLGLNRYEQAMVVQRQILALMPESLLDQGQAAMIPYLARGSAQESRDFAARIPPEANATSFIVGGRKLMARLIGDWAESIRLDQQLRYIEDFGESHWSQDLSSAYVLWAHGDQAAARDLAEHAIVEGNAELEKKPSASAWMTLATGHALLGHKADALRCGQKAKALVPEERDVVAGTPLSVTYAQVLAWVGEKDRALDELARLLRRPFGENIYQAKASALWLPLRGNPRFEALVNDPKNNAPLF